MKKKILVILVSFVIFMVYNKDLGLKIDNIEQQILLLNKRIAHYKQILDYKSDVLRKIEIQLQIDKENRKKFFSKNIDNSVIFEQIQQYINSIAKSSGLEIVSAKWGEPMEKEGYLELPLFFSCKATSYQLDYLLRSIYTYKYFLKIKSLSINKYLKDKLSLKFTISGFKIKE